MSNPFLWSKPGVCTRARRSISGSDCALNLSATLLLEEHFGEAADASRTAYDAANSIGARDIARTALGNLGFAYYRLGDSERALDLYLEAEKGAIEYGDVSDQMSWVTNIGYVQMDAGKYDLAEQS